MFENLKNIFAMKLVRLAAGMFAGSIAGAVFSNATILSWINHACTTFSSPEKLTAGITSGAIALATLYFSVKEGVTNKEKVVVAAATNSVEAANDPAIRADTIAAVKAGVLPVPDGISPETARLIQEHRAAGGKGG